MSNRKRFGAGEYKFLMVAKPVKSKTEAPATLTQGLRVLIGVVTYSGILR
jgi:hypothetical protein